MKFTFNVQSYMLLPDPTKNFKRKNLYIFHAYLLNYHKHLQCPLHVFSPPFCFIGLATLVYLCYQYKISDKGNHEPSSLGLLDKHKKHTGGRQSCSENKFLAVRCIFESNSLPTFTTVVRYVTQRMWIAVSDLTISIIIWSSTN